MSWRILIPDKVNRRAIDLLQAIPDFEVTAPGGMTRAETLAAVGAGAGPGHPQRHDR